MVDCARRHPEINFVAAHCGGTAQGNIERLAELSKDLDNLYVDISFRSHEDIELMIPPLFDEHLSSMARESISIIAETMSISPTMVSF